jgi:hypothetical protein
VAGVFLVPLDEIGGQVVQIFNHANIAGFLLYPLKSRKCNTNCLPITTKASSGAIGNLEGHILIDKK